MDRAAFHRLLAFGIERDASDIHFEAGYPPHYRVHGELLGAQRVPPLSAEDTESIARMILEERAETAPHALDFARRFPELDVSYGLPQRGRFRATIFRQRGVVGVVMRLIPIQVPSLAELGLPPVLGEIAGARRGLVLITGATGSGKTTAMAAIVRHINETRHAHVITIEDPIEFLHEPQQCMIIQREIGSDTESFRDAMGAAMRQDPDVIVVGELRGRETAQLALKAAETGALVVSALPTPDAVATIQRLAGMLEGDGRDRLAESLVAIASLRLLRGKDGKRRVAAEILRVTRELREHVRGGPLAELRELMRKGRESHAMQLFEHHLAELVRADAIEPEAARRAATDPDALEKLLKAE